MEDGGSTVGKWQWWKNKKLCILLVCEVLVILAFGLIALIRQENVHIWEAGEWMRDENSNAYIESVVLPQGIYRVQIDYTCDNDITHFSIVEKMPESQGSILCSGEHFNQGLGKTDYDLWVNTPETKFAIKVYYGGGQMELGSLKILQTDRDLYRIMFFLLAGCFVINALYLIRTYSKQYGIGKETKMLMIGLSGIILLSSIPLGNDHLYGGSDLTYHLLRIGNIKDGFLSGQFPVRIDPTWLFGNGYASSVCYGELFLYFPAFLRLIGFTIQGSWMWFLFALNVFTCLVSYYSFARIFKDRMIGLFCSALYTLSIYRLYKMYSWSAIGEVQALVFLPLILYAVYGIYTEVAAGISKRRYWIVLSVGMTGLVQCHVLTCELVVFFLALTCLILIRKTLHKEVILSFLKAIVAVCLLNAWFVIPFLDYMINMDMVIHHVSARTMQERGLMIAQLLFTFFRRGTTRELVTEGLVKVEAMGVGFAMTFSLGLFLFLWIWSRKKRTVTQISAGKFVTILAILSMSMSLNIFPWTQIQFLNSITQSLVSSIQYPNRFLMMATLFLTMTAGSTAVWLCQEGRQSRLSGGYRFTAIVITIVTSVFFMDSIVQEATDLTMYDEMGMGTGYLSGAEYLPYGTDAGLLTYHEPYPSEGVIVNEYSKEYLDVYFSCHNSLEQEGYVDVALLNYIGYVAQSDDGKYLQVIDNDNRCVRVMIPEGYDGNVHVYFKEPWYWQAAEVISILSIIMWLAVDVWRKRKV